jgi:peroxiredoxin
LFSEIKTKPNSGRLSAIKKLSIMSTVSSTLYRYADYLSEPVPENFASPRRQWVRINPLRAGNDFPELPANGQPLVVAFYSWHWNQYGDAYFAQLQQYQEVIEAAGAKLLVISSEDKKQFKLAHPEEVTFDIIHDIQHRIARKAGIYSESDPIWGRVSGVNEDVPVPAVYVLTSASVINYAFVDEYLQQPFPIEEIVAAIGTQTQLAISA